MSRKRWRIGVLVLVILFGVTVAALALLVGTPRHPMTTLQADALVRNGLPLGVNVSQVKTWLDARRIEHSDYAPHHADGADGEIISIIRDTHRSFPFISSDIQLIFTFDKKRRLRDRTVHEVVTGP